MIPIKSSCFMFLVILLFASVMESWEYRKTAEEVFLSQLIDPVTGEIDEGVAQLLWINCRLDFIHLKEDNEKLNYFFQEETSFVGGESNSYGRSQAKEHIWKMIQIQHSQLKQTLIDCTRKNRLILPVSGESGSNIPRPTVLKRNLLQNVVEAPSPVGSPFISPAPSPVGSPFVSPAPSPVVSPFVSPAPSPDLARPDSTANPAPPFFPHLGSNGSPAQSPPPARKYASPVSDSDSSKSKHNEIVTAVVVTAVVSFAFASLLFFCCTKYCKRGSGKRKNDESPLLSLSLSDSSNGSAYTSVGKNSSHHNDDSSLDGIKSGWSALGAVAAAATYNVGSVDKPSTIGLVPPPGRVLKPPPGRATPLPPEPPASLRAPSRARPTPPPPPSIPPPPCHAVPHPPRLPPPPPPLMTPGARHAPPPPPPPPVAPSIKPGQTHVVLDAKPGSPPAAVDAKPGSPPVALDAGPGPTPVTHDAKPGSPSPSHPSPVTPAARKGPPPPPPPMAPSAKPGPPPPPPLVTPAAKLGSIPPPPGAKPGPPPPPPPSTKPGPPPPPPPSTKPGPPPPAPPGAKPGPPPPPPPGAKPGPPPPNGGPAPPRAPPPMGSKFPRPPGSKLSSNASGEGNDAPKTKLKPFFWDKVLANPDHSMVWHQIKSGSFQFNEEMIETLFGYTSTDQTKAARKKDSSSQEPPSQFIQILDTKKAQNISILLRALNVTVDEVCDALYEGNELPAELIETLLKMTPTSDEELKLRVYTGQISKLGPAERFVKALIDIPYAYKRLEALLFMSNLQEEVTSTKESFGTLEVACEELTNSRLFLKLLEAVLKTGNRMNDGTFRGGAQAFKLDTLLKLSDVKGTDGKTTLLHFVVQEIIRSEGVRSALAKKNHTLSNVSIKTDDLLEDVSSDKEEDYQNLGLQVVSHLSSELENVKKAAAIDADILTGTVAKLGNSLLITKDFLHKEMENLGEGSEFHEILESFVESAEADVTYLLEEEKRIMTLVKTTGDYFHGKAGKDEGLRLFAIVRDFLMILDKVCREVGEAQKRAKSLRKVSSGSSQPSSQQPPPDLRSRLFPAITERQMRSSSSDDDS
ncbi:formin-like protein 5 [Euphorbia lathyris]|uniref:formin-like protein 5 n=1 Tax=Euphorbia lathyris TaxID=212925 RepID=UPI003313611B